MVVLRGIDTADPLYATPYFGDAPNQISISGHSLRNGYSLYWWLCNFNGFAVPSVTAQPTSPNPLTTFLAISGGGHDEQILVAGRDSGIEFQPIEVAGGFGATGYISSGIMNLRTV